MTDRSPMDDPIANAACGCSGLSRARLLRRAAAAAAAPGAGLPAIERGMPLPAGTGLTRRSFVSRTAGMALAVYGASALGWDAFDDGIARAAAAAPDHPVFLSVFLEGGCDGLSILAPKQANHPRYAQLRPTLALPVGQGTTFTEDPTLRWHPSAAPLAQLHAEHKVTVMPGVGYSHPDQSHFTSRHYWEVGATDAHLRLGWMGRYLDAHGTSDNPLQGLSLDWDLSPALAAGDVPIATVYKPEDYDDFWSPSVWGPVEDAMHGAIGNFGNPPANDPGLAQARGAALSTAKLREQLAPFGGGYQTPQGVTYPTGSDFPERLAALAAMLAAGLPLRCVAMQAAGGYDTHSDQAATLPGNIDLVSKSLLAFQRDLEARGLADRVLTHVWSEFGRRPEENGSGTDHGAAGTSLLIGSRVAGTMLGEFPGLATLDEQDNLRETFDFRRLYSGVLDQWFGVDSAQIIPANGLSAPPTLLN